MEDPTRPTEPTESRSVEVCGCVEVGRPRDPPPSPPPDPSLCVRICPHSTPPTHVRSSSRKEILRRSERMEAASPKVSERGLQTPKSSSSAVPPSPVMSEASSIASPSPRMQPTPAQNGGTSSGSSEEVRAGLPALSAPPGTRSDWSHPCFRAGDRPATGGGALAAPAAGLRGESCHVGGVHADIFALCHAEPGDE